MTDAPERIQIKHRWTDAVLFECEPTTECVGMSFSMKLGWAVKKAVKAGANLANADLADADLAGADLADANLADADLARAYLAGADLARADLARANLARAYLAGANLARANLANADLAGANLANAYLANADLAGADLADADLAGAYLARANLANAKIRYGITINRAPIQISGLEYPIIIFDVHMQIGCELHSIAEWATFDNERIAQMDGLRARKFWGRHKAAILALAASDNRKEEV